MAYDRYGANNPNWKGGEVTLLCEACGQPFHVRPHRKETAKACSRHCHGILTGKTAPRLADSPHWKDGRQVYKDIAGFNATSICKWCSHPHNLTVHHMDHNRLNNDSSNLIIICRSCHQKWHKIGSWLNSKDTGKGHHRPPRPGQPGTPEFQGP